MIICISCGTDYNPSHGPQKRCGSCRSLTCQFCHKQFFSANARPGQKFCSRDCKDRSQGGQEPQSLAANRGVKPRTYHLRHRDKHGSAADVEWRKAVFERDGYRCRECGSGGRLHAHHIKPYKAFPELRHVLSNGRTLCVPCHKKTDSFGWANYWKNEIAAKRLAQKVLNFT